MPLKKSDFRNEIRPLPTIVFPLGTLNVKFYPGRLTPNLQKKFNDILQEELRREKTRNQESDEDVESTSSIESDTENIKSSTVEEIKSALAVMLCELLESWDLLEDDGTTIPITEAGFADIPVEVQFALMKAVNDSVVPPQGKSKTSNSFSRG